MKEMLGRGKALPTAGKEAPVEGRAWEGKHTVTWAEGQVPSAEGGVQVRSSVLGLGPGRQTNMVPGAPWGPGAETLRQGEGGGPAPTLRSLRAARPAAC